MWETLYRVHAQELTRYCYGICKDADLAQDMVQEAFLCAIQHCELEDMGLQQRRAWLYKVVRNLMYDKLRKNAVEARYEKILEKDWEAEEDYGTVEMQQLLCRLPPRDRTLFQMRYLEGYNASELGEIFGEPASTIRSRLSKIRKVLKKMLL